MRPKISVLPPVGRSLRAILMSGCVLLLTAGTAAAQTQTGVQFQQPTFRAEAREVVLDIVVTDKNGQPVSNLKRDEFKVFEDSVEQRIVSFSAPADHLPPPGSPPITSAAGLVHAGNIPINIIILDELNTAFEDTAFGRKSVERYLQSQPATLAQPTTILSISDSGLKQLHDYTQNRDDLIKTVHGHFPVYPFRMMKGLDVSGPDASERLARSLGTLLQIAQSVEGYKGRKSILWIGKGFPSLDTTQVNEPAAKEVNDATKLVTATLLRTRTVLNIIDPTPLSVSTVDFSDADLVSPNTLNEAVGTNGTSLFPGDINFADFAPATGGLAFFARNDVDKEIGTAISDGADYYTLSYSPTNKSDDAEALRKINVKMTDPSLVVWTRTGYYRTHEAKPSEKPVTPDAHQLAFDLMNAAVSTVAYNALQVTAVRKGDKYDVTVQPSGLDFHPSTSGGTLAEVTVMEATFDTKNHVLDHSANEITRPVSAPPWVMNFTVPASSPRGAARVRLVVRDLLNGRMGTVDITP